MAQILRFPKLSIRPLRVQSGSLHEVTVRVVDKRNPSEARWHLQYAVQRAAGFRALKGLTDQAALRQRPHRFAVGRTFRIKRFLRETERLIAENRILVSVDGRVVRLRHTIAA